ncbi:MAG: hypothetical protein ABIQ89_03195 [Candidatus Saccharimonadales bacterium]
MPDVMLSTEGLFENAEFDGHLTEWQRAQQTILNANNAFGEAVAVDYEDSSRSKDAIEEDISYILEMTPEELKDSFRFDGLSEKAQRLAELRGQATVAKAETRAALLEFATELGAHQFVLFGLSEVLRPYSDRQLSRLTLVDGVSATEKKLKVIDRIARENSGEVLTVVSYPMSIEAGQLGVGGLTIADNRHGVLPMADGRQSFSVSMSSHMDEIYPNDTFLLDGRTLLSDNLALITPEQYCANEDHLYDRATLVLGQIPEGPPRVENKENVKHSTMILNRARTVGRLAASQ